MYNKGDILVVIPNKFGPESSIISFAKMEHAESFAKTECEAGIPAYICEIKAIAKVTIE